MAIKLTITTDGDPGAEYVRSFMQDRIVIGRSRSADVCLPAMAVSTRHAEIRLVDADYAVADLDSLNGTTVNGKAVLPFRNRVLKSGDTISIAGFRLGFQKGVPAGPTEQRDTAVQQARDILANVLARSGQTVETNSLYVMTGPSRGTRIELPKGTGKLVLGRGNGVDFFVDDPDVSRHHAEVVIEAAGVFVRDLRSRNGIYVDGKRVDAAKLEVGSQFVLGSSTIALEHPAERTLGLIFEAPEEDTSSFVLKKERPSRPSAPADEERISAAEDPPELPTSKTPPTAAPTPTPPPVIGPADPLVADVKSSRTTGKHPLSAMNDYRPGQRDRQGTDVGLIVVGAIILIAAVSGLIYIFH